MFTYLFAGMHTCVLNTPVKRGWEKKKSKKSKNKKKYVGSHVFSVVYKQTYRITGFHKQVQTRKVWPMLLPGTLKQKANLVKLLQPKN